MRSIKHEKRQDIFVPSKDNNIEYTTLIEYDFRFAPLLDPPPSIHPREEQWARSLKKIPHFSVSANPKLTRLSFPRTAQRSLQSGEERKAKSRIRTVSLVRPAEAMLVNTIC